MDYTKIKIGVISLGCDKNRVDTEKLLGIITKKSQLTDNLNDANVVVINTCAFLQSAREESIENILDVHSLRTNGNLQKIVVTGCLPQKYVGDIFDDFVEVDVFLGISDYDRFFEALDIAFQGKRVNLVGGGDRETDSKRVLSTPKSYAYLKIADGCNNFCTYCLIPKIRGRYRSVEMQTLVEEAANLGELQELILVAQDITRYGEDLYGKPCLVKLIKELSQLQNIKGIRLLYAYPDKLTDEIIDEIATNPKVIKYLDMPLQHASDTLLKRMNRRGTMQSYLQLIQKLKSKVNGISLRSTFIAGFPGESEKEFEELLQFIKVAKLTNAGFFAYSREEDTPAYKMEGQIDEKVKLRRVKRLYTAQKNNSKNFLKGFVGKVIEVVCDGFDSQSLAYKCRAYFNAPDIDGCVYLLADKEVAVGQRLQVLVTGADDYDLYAKLND